MKESERDLYRKFSSVQTKLDARSHALTTLTMGVGKGSAGEEVHNENSEGTAGALTQCGGWGGGGGRRGMGKKAFSAARVHKEKARDAALVTNND